MKPSETAKVLAKAALIDNRTVDEMTIAAWHETIAHLDYRDALDAVTMHFQRSDQYLKPKHLIDLAREAKRNREHAENAERAKHALPPGKPQPVPEFFRRFRDSLGKGPYAPLGAQKTPHGSGSHEDTARPSETPQGAAQGHGTETV